MFYKQETSSKSSSPTLADISLRTNSSDISEETKKKTQKAKMKAYLLKKKRGMLGYSKKRKRKKKKHSELDELVSTTSSDLLDIRLGFTYIMNYYRKIC